MPISFRGFGCGRGMGHYFGRGSGRDQNNGSGRDQNKIKSCYSKKKSGFNKFRRRMTNKVFFEEIRLGIFVRNKNVHFKSNFWPCDQYKK